MTLKTVAILIAALCAVQMVSLVLSMPREERSVTPADDSSEEDTLDNLERNFNRIIESTRQQLDTYAREQPTLDAMFQNMSTQLQALTTTLGEMATRLQATLNNTTAPAAEAVTTEAAAA